MYNYMPSYALKLIFEISVKINYDQKNNGDKI